MNIFGLFSKIEAFLRFRRPSGAVLVSPGVLKVEGIYETVYILEGVPADAVSLQWVEMCLSKTFLTKYGVTLRSYNNGEISITEGCVSILICFDANDGYDAYMRVVVPRVEKQGNQG